MKTFALINLGCSKNVIDGERMIFRLCQAGYRQVADPVRAAIIIVNTCAFIQPAQQEAIDTILAMARYKKEGRCKTLVVTGCFAGRFRKRSARLMPEVDVWCGVSDWPAIFAAVFKTASVPSWRRSLTGSHVSQYLKIAEGCSHRCSYCVIPAIRGSFKSRSTQDILREAQWLYETGVRECVLVAQDTSRYGCDNNFSLARLCELLLKKTAFPWIRLMYLHPAHLGDDLIGLIAGEKRLCSYFDIPIQHCCDDILKAMHRAPGRAGLIKLFEHIRNTAPDATLRTSLITGFPGETEKHFNQLLLFCELVRFDKLGVFPFSPEEGTPAARLAHRPRAGTAARRAETVMAVQRDISAMLLQKKIGQTVEVLLEEKSDNAAFPLQGRTQGDAPEVDGAVFVKNMIKKNSGPFVNVRIVDAGDYDLFAEAR